MQRPLVSVILTTYNSAKFVVETLESVRAQSYQHIELIVSDDCSADNTVELCRNWIALHKDRFVRTDIITVPQNTGVSANCNRCIKASNSEWIKLIAGDDILLPNCIEDNMTFVANNPIANIVFSQVKVYQNTFQEVNYTKTTPMDFPNNLMEKSLTAQDQFKLLLVSDRIHYTPAYFFNKLAIKEVGGYDESNRLVEDYPMWLKLTNAGIRLYYFHIPTVGYRIHTGATNNTGSFLFKPSIINGYAVRKKYVHPHLSWLQVKQETWAYVVTLGFKKLNLVSDSYVNKIMYKIASVYFNPFIWMLAIQKKFNLENRKLLLSIIVPMYNVAPYVERCLRSLATQDIAYEDYEIICINDGSPDNCQKIVEDLQKELPNLVLINQENQGVSMARNNGIDKASGTYLLMIDPDDYVEPYSLKVKLDLIIEKDLDIGVTGYKILTEDFQVEYTYNPKDDKKIYDGIAYFNSYLKGRPEIKDPDRSWAIFFKKFYLTNNSLRYVSGLPFLEDGEFMYRVFSLAQKVMFLSEVFYLRTTRQGSATHSSLYYSEKARLGFIRAAMNLQNFKTKQCKSEDQLIFMNQPIVKFTVLSLTSLNIVTYFKNYVTLNKALKRDSLKKLDTDGCNSMYKRLGKSYNIGISFFYIDWYFLRFINYMKNKLNFKSTN